MPLQQSISLPIRPARDPQGVRSAAVIDFSRVPLGKLLSMSAFPGMPLVAMSQSKLSHRKSRKVIEASIAIVYSEIRELWKSRFEVFPAGGRAIRARIFLTVALTFA
jgi:hypothetical protein